MVISKTENIHSTIRYALELNSADEGMTMYQLGYEDPFPLDAIYSHVWKNDEGQLSFLTHAVSVAPEVFGFFHSARKLRARENPVAARVQVAGFIGRSGGIRTVPHWELRRNSCVMAFCVTGNSSVATLLELLAETRRLRFRCLHFGPEVENSGLWRTFSQELRELNFLRNTATVLDP